MPNPQPTIRDIANRAGVSCTTVSRALNNQSGIHEATRERILRLCEELGYIPNAAARSLVMSNSSTIGFLVSQFLNPFFTIIASGLESELNRQNHSLFLCNANYSPEAELHNARQLLQQNVAGIVLAPSTHQSAINVEKLVSGHRPLVIIGSNGSTEAYRVSNDNLGGAYMGTRYLLGLGHKRILFLGGHKHSETRRLRLEGYRLAMKEAGCNPMDLTGDYDTHSYSRGYKEATHHLLQPNPCTAIFAYNDQTALGILKAADELGVRVPDDLSLLGFDNTPFAALNRIDLTTIGQPLELIGEMSAKIILKLIRGEEAERVTILRPELIIRKTCTPPRQP